MSRSADRRRSRTSTPTGPPRAVIYARISKDRNGEGDGVERQIAACRDRARREGWKLITEPLRDDSISAWRSGVVRPAYQQLLTLVRERQVDVVAVFHMSRLWRGRVERATGIDVFREAGVRLAVVQGQEIDFSSAMGRGMVSMLGEVDTMESDLKSERLLAQKAQAAALGRFRGGARPFGYAKDGVTLVEHEAALIREACAAVLAGRSVRAITREWNEAGVRTSRGNAWTVLATRDVLVRGRNAGLVTTGRRTAKDDTFEVVTLSGSSADRTSPRQTAWTPIVDEDTWRAVRDTLLDPSRRTNPDGTERRWLLSGIARCGVAGCDSKLATVSLGGTPARRTPRQVHYKCEARAHLTVHQQHTDDLVTRTVAALLRDERLVAALTPSPENEARIADRERRAVLVRRLRQTERDYDEDVIDARRYRSKRDKLSAELAVIDERLAAAAASSVASPLLGAHDPARAFLDAPLDLQRQLVRAAVEVTVLPSTRRGGVFDPSRVQVTPLTATGS